MAEVQVPMKVVTAARRDVIVKVLRMKGEMDLQALNRLLTQLHEAGKWPQATWGGARNDPYDTGTRQHLDGLKRAGRVRARFRENDYRVYYSAPTAEELLPEDRLRFEQAIINARAGDFIRDVVIGVTSDFRRVIRMDTRRGEVERFLKDHETWEEAARDVGLEV